MRNVIKPLLALVGAVMLSICSANGETRVTATPLESNSELAKQAIATALDEFKKRLSNTDGYRIAVVQVGSSIWVTFQDPDLPAGWRGGSDTKLGFAVELSQDAKQVISSHFIR